MAGLCRWSLAWMSLALVFVALAAYAGSHGADRLARGETCPDDPVLLAPTLLPLPDGARFGSAVAGLGGGLLAVGAPGAMAGAGAVFFWHVEAAGQGELLATELPPVAGPGGKQAVGAVVAPAGDVDGDGIPDVGIGQPDGDGIVIYSLARSSFLQDALPPSLQPCAGCQFGAALAGNPTGRRRAQTVSERLLLVVGAPGADGHRGRVDVVWEALASEGGGVRHVQLTGEQASERFGAAVALADVNGDGDLDVVVTSPGYRRTDDGAPRGRVRVLRAPDYLRFAPGWTSFEGESPGEEAGSAVASAGDVDGDGSDDIVVGAPSFSTNASSEPGRVYVVSGGTGAVLHSLEGRHWHVGRSRIGERFGTALAGFSRPTDFNNDGRPDFAVGAPLASPGGRLGAGAVYVFGGPKREGSGKLLVRYDGTTPGDALGAAVASAGDLNADGFQDLLVGAPHALDPAATKPVRSGLAYVLLGGPCKRIGR